MKLDAVFFRASSTAALKPKHASFYSFISFIFIFVEECLYQFGPEDGQYIYNTMFTCYPLFCQIVLVMFNRVEHFFSDYKKERFKVVSSLDERKVEKFLKVTTPIQETRRLCFFAAFGVPFGLDPTGIRSNWDPIRHLCS
ncbi:hypothetical protein L596_016467 [Steinernema carpocapsae]|uniref:Uncharacterized protein n=1 Tax=Steinernema carpocapsae TaxID=34508 RepID=A0A4U5NI60_STECR|nr:hypothetical protein L596_016467 [Steinernema carpocapsae]